MVKHFDKRFTEVGAPPGTLFIAGDAEKSEIRAIRYGEDHLAEIDVSDPEEILPLLAQEGVVWIDVRGLGDETMLRRLATIFSIHPLAIEDIVNIPQRPKAAHYDEHLLVVTRMARLRGPLDLDIEQVSILFGDGFVVTFQERVGDVLEPVRNRLRVGSGAIRRLGADYLAYCILDTITDAYFPILEATGEYLEALEDRIVESPGPRTLATLSDAKHFLLNLRRAMWPMRDAAAALARDPSRFIHEEVRLYLRDTYDHCVQSAEVTETFRELVSDLMNTYLSVVANRTNDIMRVLTIAATIFIPLTFITGLYGMNFDDMPEYHLDWAYPVVLVVMVAIAIGLTAFFWRRGWLGSNGHRPDRPPPRR